MPERRAELTTEGGLDVAGQKARVGEALARCRDAGIEVALSSIPTSSRSRPRRNWARRRSSFTPGATPMRPSWPRPRPRARAAHGGRRSDHRRRVGTACRPRPELPERRAGRAAPKNGRAQHRPQHRQPRVFVGLTQAVSRDENVHRIGYFGSSGKPWMIRCARHDQATFHGRHHECRHLCAWTRQRYLRRICLEFDANEPVPASLSESNYYKIRYRLTHGRAIVVLCA